MCRKTEMEKESFSEIELDIDFLFDAIIFQKFVPTKRAAKMTMELDADVLFLRPYVVPFSFGDEHLSIMYWSRKGLI